MTIVASAQMVKITEYPLPDGQLGPYGIASGPDGALWFTSSSGVSRLTTGGVITNSWPLDSAIAGIRYATQPIASDIIAGPDGALWFNFGYSKISDPHSYGGFARLTTAGSLAAYDNYRPVSGFTYGPDGAIWYAQASGCHGGSSCLFDGQPIGRMTTTGVFSHYPLPGGVNESAYRITAGPDNALWFTSTNGNIGRITTSGEIAEYAVSTTDGYISGIVAGPDGALWFTDSLNNSIGRITTAGVVSEYPVPTASSIPYAIAAGPDGALWFTELASNRIGRITTAGVVTEYATPTDGSQPLAITTGPDGALWFTESGAKRIGRLSLTGKSLSMGYSGNLPSGVVGVLYPPYAQLFTASGGTPPYTWSATGLPPGMTLSSAAFFSGTPTVSGTFSVAVEVQDSSSPKLVASQNFPIVINSGGPLAILTASPLPSGTAGEAYSFNLSATGGTLPYKWSVVGDLPSGLSLSDVSTGLISGTPAVQGASNFTVQVTDHASATATLALTLNVSPAGSGGTGGPAQSRSGVLSQVSSGGGWKSSVYIYNPSPAPASVTLNFWDDQGAPLSLPWEVTASGGSQSLNAASLSENIAPYATILIETSSQSASAVSGWAEVLSSTAIRGYGVFHYTSTAGIQSEGTVPFETGFQPSFLMPYDNLNSFQTAVALTNLAAGAPASLSVTVWGENGSQLAAQTIKLPAGGHISSILTNLLAATTANRGVIQFRSVSGGNITGLGLRVNPLGGFTSIPNSPGPQ